MERQRRSFTEEHKRQAVELVVSSRRSVTSVAKELGLRDSVLRRSVDKLRQEPTYRRSRPTPQATPMSANQLRRSPGCARRTNGCAWRIATSPELR
ncbi:transposase [Bradyrhizobium sp. PMVTL-01]|uniref:transposase n=1 Tax=Bradyrhizobium sp. PMVTL-01 TaxID=3434999 RepID=UPI003F7237EF